MYSTSDNYSILLVFSFNVHSINLITHKITIKIHPFSTQALTKKDNSNDSIPDLFSRGVLSKLVFIVHRPKCVEKQRIHTRNTTNNFSTNFTVSFDFLFMNSTMASGLLCHLIKWKDRGPPPEARSLRMLKFFQITNKIEKFKCFTNNKQNWSFTKEAATTHQQNKDKQDTNLGNVMQTTELGQRRPGHSKIKWRGKLQTIYQQARIGIL